MTDVNSDTGRECLKMKEYPYNNALFGKNTPKWIIRGGSIPGTLF